MSSCTPSPTTFSGRGSASSCFSAVCSSTLSSTQLPLCHLCTHLMHTSSCFPLLPPASSALHCFFLAGYLHVERTCKSLLAKRAPNYFLAMCWSLCPEVKTGCACPCFGDGAATSITLERFCKLLQLLCHQCWPPLLSSLSCILFITWCCFCREYQTTTANAGQNTAMLFGEATANTFPVSSFQKFTDVHCTLEDNPNILISESIINNSTSTSTWFSKTNFAQRYAKTL